MLYLVCMACEDKFIVDEPFVEIADADDPNQTKQVGLDYRGHDCLCPICEKFAGRLVGP